MPWDTTLLLIAELLKGMQNLQNHLWQNLKRKADALFLILSRNISVCNGSKASLGKESYILKGTIPLGFLFFDQL